MIQILLSTNIINIQQSIDLNTNKSILPFLLTLNNSIHLIPQLDQDNNKLVASPLHLSSFLGNVKWIELLIEKGYPVAPTNAFNTHPLHLAVYSKQNEAAEKLIEKGALIRAVSKTFHSIFHIAIAQVYLFILLFLLYFFFIIFLSTFCSFFF